MKLPQLVNNHNIPLPTHLNILALVRMQKNNKTPDLWRQIAESEIDAIDRLITWSYTPEGHGFWYHIYYAKESTHLEQTEERICKDSAYDWPQLKKKTEPPKTPTIERIFHFG